MQLRHQLSVVCLVVRRRQLELILVCEIEADNLDPRLDHSLDKFECEKRLANAEDSEDRGVVGYKKIGINADRVGSSWKVPDRILRHVPLLRRNQQYRLVRLRQPRNGIEASAAFVPEADLLRLRPHKAAGVLLLKNLLFRQPLDYLVENGPTLDLHLYETAFLKVKVSPDEFNLQDRKSVV